jgi:5-methylcytosine-specific restriction protein A
MAFSPKRPCRKPNCHGIAVADGLCERCGKITENVVESRRQSSAKRGYGRKWREASQGYLRSHPLCRHCQQRGKLVQATLVDHIRPHRGDWSLFWDTDNWQELCDSCHSAKTVREDGGFGRKSNHGKSSETDGAEEV